MTRLDERYNQVFQTLSRVELQKGAADLDELDFPDLLGPSGGDLWLRFYSREGLETAFDRYGFFRDLAEVGYQDVHLELRVDDPDEHLLRIFSVDPPLPRSPLLEIVVRREVMCTRDALVERVGSACLPVLTVEWLQLQNPRGEFTPQRPPLPGQRHPGLGLGEQVLELLRQACKRIGLHGLTTVPSYFHNAYFYSGEFQYVDPYEQGVFLALSRDVLAQTGGSIPAATWAIKWQMVASRDDPRRPFEWFHDCMAAPVSDQLIAYFEDPAYQREVEQAMNSHAFVVFRDALAKNLEARGIIPLEPKQIARWIEQA